MNEKLKKYPSTPMFSCVDTLGVPHPFMIGPKHVAHASDYHSGRLGEETCRKIPCAMRGCRLTYEQHEQAILVGVKSDKDLNDIPELKEYLMSIKAMAEADGFAGFAFKQEV